VPEFASIDSLVLLLYLFFVLAVGISLKPLLSGSLDFLQAGRALPAWVCGVAMTAASLGPLELTGMSAAGARYGFAGIPFYVLGAILPILFAALFLMPVYYGSKARTLPEFLALRFDGKTRTLHAVLFAAMALLSASASLYVMARVFAALHVFEAPLRAAGLDARGAMIFSMALPAVLVLAYILLGGLTGAIYNFVIQFFVIVAGLLPVVFLSLKQIGGWGGLKSTAGLSAFAQRSGGASGHVRIATIAAAAALGLVFSAGTWCADFRVLQVAMAAKDAEAARRAPLIAAALRVFVPFVFVLPAIAALGLPTPHTTIVIHSENGAIYHDITVVPPEVDAGQGLVPAQIDPVTGKPLKDSDGRTLLDGAMAAPQVLVHFLPTGLLGLGIAALLASMMGGMAASLTAFATVFVCDLYEPLLRKDASPDGTKPDRSVAVMRWTILAGMLLSLGVALLAVLFGSLSTLAILVTAVVIAPLLATLLLGVFFKRTTANGAFFGLIAGALAAPTHHGLALPAGQLRGIHGGWIAVLHRPSSELRFDLGTTLCAFFASLIVTSAVSAFTSPPPESELTGLVWSASPRPPAKAESWQRPQPLAIAILLAAIVLCVVFA
jgi:solute:Na+ symporter, SSS family